MLRTSLLVGTGGFVGSCLRYWAGLAGARLAGAPTPWSTAFVNVTGCFLIGALAARGLSPELRAFVLVGVLGGYTTFSTFGYETWALFDQDRAALALANAAGQLVLGVLAVGAGVFAARSLA
jgi:fluoride exporter